MTELLYLNILKIGDSDLEYLKENIKTYNLNMNLILRFAAALNYLNVAKYALDNNADINENEGTPISLAALYGHIQMIFLLLKFKADINLGRGTLTSAVQSNHKKIVEILLQNGADIHLVEDNALRVAILNKNVPMISFLFRNGANYKNLTIDEQRDLLTFYKRGSW